MRRALQSVAITAVIVLSLLLLSPWLIYEATLMNIDGRPAKPTRMASTDEQARVWRLARGRGELKVEPMNPYGFVWRFFSGDSSVSRGETLAYWMSCEHIWKQPRRSMAWWHLSNAALTIWLTRHWTAEELATAMVPVTNRWQPREPWPDEAAAPAQP